MPADQTFTCVTEFAKELDRLHSERATLKESGRKRSGLTGIERAKVLEKADGRCHICGGLIGTEKWQADHVFPHSGGGSHEVENYLPAHSLCNRYRWDHGAEEFQWVLKLGVWLRTQIKKQTTAGKSAGEQFLAHERRRAMRRRSSKSAAPSA